MTVQRAWKLNLKKEPKPTRQHIITIVKRFQETGSLLPSPKKKKMVADEAYFPLVQPLNIQIIEYGQRKSPLRG